MSARIKRDKRTIRLQMRGRKQYIVYDIVVTSKRKRSKGAIIEKLGFLNPNSQERVVFINTERLCYWLNRGVKMNRKILRFLTILAVSAFYANQKKENV